MLGLNAVNCHNGDPLAQEQVLKALGNGATKLRAKLGESLASVQRYDAPPENVTTPSLEALQAYSLGYQANLVASDFANSIPHLQRAVKLDPNFAMAWALMGTNYFSLGEPDRAAEAAHEAYELRARTSEQEKLFISAMYEASVTGTCRQLARPMSYGRKLIRVTSLPRLA